MSQDVSRYFRVRLSSKFYTLRVTVMIWNRLSMNIFIFQNSFSPHSFQTKIISRSRFILTWIKSYNQSKQGAQKYRDFETAYDVRINLLFEIMTKRKYFFLTSKNKELRNVAISKQLIRYEFNFSSNWWQNENMPAASKWNASKPTQICLGDVLVKFEPWVRWWWGCSPISSR